MTINCKCFALAIFALLLQGCGEDKPSNGHYKEFVKNKFIGMANSLPISDLDVIVQENLGSKVQPLWRAKLVVALESTEAIYRNTHFLSTDKVFRVYKHVIPEGISPEYEIITDTTQVGGKWKTKQRKVTRLNKDSRLVELEHSRIKGGVGKTKAESDPIAIFFGTDEYIALEKEVKILEQSADLKAGEIKDIMKNIVAGDHKYECSVKHKESWEKCSLEKPKAFHDSKEQYSYKGDVHIYSQNGEISKKAVASFHFGYTIDHAGRGRRVWLEVRDPSYKELTKNTFKNQRLSEFIGTTDYSFATEKFKLSFLL